MKRYKIMNKCNQKSSLKKRVRLSSRQLSLRKKKRKNLENYAEMWAKNAYYSYAEDLK